MNYFPLGIAKGTAFCNRIHERKQLRDNIDKGQHTLVISPRRYGKSSMVLYSLEESRLSYERVDLFVAIDAKTVQIQILNGVKNLLNKINSVPEQIVSVIKNYIKKLKSKWIVGTDGVRIELIPASDSDEISVITESLQMLEDVLRKKKMIAVFFIDEFQEIGVLASSKGIEGAIRHVAQETDYLRFIFSGSNRHILASMFDDRVRPLYSLCDRITIDRIHRDDYFKYINQVAKKTWHKLIDASVLEEILLITERHPYYVNVLCDKIWSTYDNALPTKAVVNKLWQEYVMQEKSKVAMELSSLNASQKKLLIAIAHGATKDLTGKEALQIFNFSSSTIVRSLQLLEQKDYLGRDKNGAYFLIDPLINASLVLFY